MVLQLEFTDCKFPREIRQVPLLHGSSHLSRHKSAQSEYMQTVYSVWFIFNYKVYTIHVDLASIKAMHAMSISFEVQILHRIIYQKH